MSNTELYSGAIYTSETISQLYLFQNMESAESQIWACIEDRERKFYRAANQVTLLNRVLEQLQVRYNRAKQANIRSLRYAYRLQYTTYEGVRNMFYEFAVLMSEELVALQDIFYDVTGVLYEVFTIIILVAPSISTCILLT